MCGHTDQFSSNQFINRDHPLVGPELARQFHHAARGFRRSLVLPFQGEFGLIASDLGTVKGDFIFDSSLGRLKVGRLLPIQRLLSFHARTPAVLYDTIHL